jgi:hypothetical protein
MLELTDTGTALSGAGTVVCPTASKIYIVKNAAGQNITVKTSGGTGILVPDGRTTFLFCDGTNVVEALTHTTSLQLGTSTTVTAVLDEDNMASDSATSLATQQSIKAYVDAQVGANNELSEVLANGNTSGANDIIVDNGQKITTNTIDETTADSGVTIDSVLLKDDGVNATNLEVTNIKANDGTAAGSIADSTGVVTVASAVLTTADINGGTADGVAIGATTPSTVVATNLTANTDLTIASTVTVTSILDEDNMASDDPAGLATQQSIKAYVDSQVGTVDTWSEVLANGNTSGATDAVITAGQKITTDTIDETTAAAGVTIDSVLLKDDVVNASDIETSTISANDGTTAINIADSTGAVDIDTSLNVDGTITSDGLTVDGLAKLQGPATGLVINETDTTDLNSYIYNNGGDLNIATTNDAFNTFTTRINLDHSTGDITFYDGANASFVYDANSGSTFNDNQDARDFTVKSDNSASMLVVDGTNDRVGINRGSPSYTLDVQGDVGIAHTGAVPLAAEGTAAAGFSYMQLVNLATSANGVGTGIEFRAKTSVQERQTAYITSWWSDVTDASRTSTFNISQTIDGGGRNIFRCDGSTISINQNGIDLDFKVKSNNVDNMLFVDGGLDRVGVGTNSPSGKLTISGGTANDYSDGITLQKSGGNIFGIYPSTNNLEFRSITGANHIATFEYGGHVAFGATDAKTRVQLEDNAGFETDSTATSATTQTAVYSFSATNFTGAKFLVCVTDSTATERYITELLVTHDGTTAVATEYGQVATDTALATFDVDISGGNVRLLATPASSNSMTFKVMSTQLLA